MTRLRVLYVEPFDGGSHAAFGLALRRHAEVDWTWLTMPARHWKWRMRGAAAWLADRHAAELARPHDVLLASSFVDLPDLIALAPSIARVPKVVYFHENQWAYPSDSGRDDGRDHHFGFTQLWSAAAADAVWFNSRWNRDSFLEGSRTALRSMPDRRPSAWIERIAARSRIVPVPLELDSGAIAPDPPPGPHRAVGPRIVWNHRWEHDKAPEVLFDVCERLARRDVPFRLVVLGQRHRRWPAVFDDAPARLGSRLEHLGPVDDRAGYLGWLGRAQIALSTARHEFFGIAMLEAVHAGARPLVPDGLAYPEHFAADDRYRDPDHLLDRVESLCRDWTAGRIGLRADRRARTAPYRAEVVVPALVEALAGVASTPA